MREITAHQLRQALDDLPDPRSVDADYYRVVVRDPHHVAPEAFDAPIEHQERFIEFWKSNGQWVLVLSAACRMEPHVRAFVVKCCGVTAVTFATSAAKARYNAALAAWDAGYMDTANPAKATARRAPEHDHRSARATNPRACYSVDCLP